MGVKINFITKIEKIENIHKDERERLKKVTQRFPFRTNEYYLSLIDWDDPNDPIKRISIPAEEELIEWGDLDPSSEKSYTKLKGLEHKYSDTCILLLTDVCAMYCRFCFRKRLFMHHGAEITLKVDEVISYIKAHPEVNNVLLTGGDPLLLATPKLAMVLKELSKIPHVRVVRIGSKIPASYPFRILEDHSLLELFKDFNEKNPDKRLYLMTHFNHPKELTSYAKEAIKEVQKTGTILCNQTPILRGINDNKETLKTLAEELTALGVAPYYFFQCRPVLGNRHFVVPIEKALDIVEKVRSEVSGLAGRFRYVKSHRTGKIEILGKWGDFVLFKYIRAANPADRARLFVCKENPEALWLEDYEEIVSINCLSKTLVKAPSKALSFSLS